MIAPCGVCMHKGILTIWAEYRRHLATTIAAFRSRIVISLLLMGCLATIVAGPFGTFYTMDLARRAVYWGAIIAIGLGVGALVNAALLTVCRDWPPLGIDLAASLAVSTLLAPLILMLRAGLDPSLTRADLGLVTIWLITLVFVVPVFSLRRQLLAPSTETEPSHPHPQPRPRLLRRLPEPMQDATILRLAGRNHAVAVVTDRGTETLRLRLSDAIEEMTPVEGLCTHRSHWVTRTAITGHVRESGKLFVTLENGDRVPVSRTYRPQLEAEGLVPAQEGAT